VGDCFLWAVFRKLQKYYKHFWLLFPRIRLCIYCDKKLLGYILGEFFANSSGHHAGIHLVAFSLEAKKLRNSSQTVSGRLNPCEKKTFFCA
jgi:hypothetical protein